MSSAPVVVVGIGELGAVFARGFLRRGHAVHPVTRDTDANELANRMPNPALVLIAVGEGDLQGVLETLPSAWRPRVGLVQNELLPRDWTRHDIEPTVTVVWFEKKRGMDSKVLVPSVSFGPVADLVTRSLDAIGIDARTEIDEAAFVADMVGKNLYILTVNIAGLETGGTVHQLWTDHRELADAVVADVLDLQQALVGRTLPREALVAGFERAVAADPDHRCTGRTAPARLARALEHGDRLGLALPALRRIATRVAP